MSDTLSALEPRPVWSHFAELAAIPRPSKQEARVAAYVESVAAARGWSVRRDAAGNVVVGVPATAGSERAPVVVLQGHLDMVGEKNRDVAHDFDRDPIRPRVVGEWVHATGTTLGADNGIGVAAALAAAGDPAVPHGPLELLFTVDEETGLTGARDLDPAIVTGRILLNLDSEEDGVLFVGCAGGTDSILDLAAGRSAPSSREAVRLEIAGLRGGHSGINIHENRGNALKLAVRILAAAVDRGIRIEVASLRGGSKHNAIPREAEAVIAIGDGGRRRFETVVAGMTDAFRTELEGVDDGLVVRVADAPPPQRVLGAADSLRLVRLLLALPHGVLAMSRDIPGLTETSSNLAVVQADGDRIRVVTSSRSSVAASLEHVLASIRAAAELSGAGVETADAYPGWKPDLRSNALATVREVYREHWGKDPHVTAIHAGLECGLLGGKIPGLDMVSFGPQIEGAHSPDERVHVPSVARFYGALAEVLRRYGTRTA